MLIVLPELSSARDYVITHSVRSMYVVCVCMYVVFCQIDHCIHIHWCIVMGLGHNELWVESHMWPQQTWGQRSSRGQWPLVQVFGKKGQCIHILWCIFKSNITMIAKVCDRESRRDTWFENRLVSCIDFQTKMWWDITSLINYTCQLPPRVTIALYFVSTVWSLATTPLDKPNYFPCVKSV